MDEDVLGPLRLHRRYVESGQTHAGIVVIHQQRFSVGEVIRRLLALVTSKSPDEMRDQLVYLSWVSHSGQ